MFKDNKYFQHGHYSQGYGARWAGNNQPHPHFSVMRAKELAQLVTSSCLGAFAFLHLARIASSPACCGNNHPWTLYEPASGKMPYLWCTHQFGEEHRARTKSDRVRSRRFMCSEKCSWCDGCPWAKKLNKLKPRNC